jgi:hypothetical protein
MMKNAQKTKSVVFRLVAIAFVVCACALCTGGCGYVARAGAYTGDFVARVVTLGSKPEAYAQLGETEAEAHRRHLRVSRINRQQLMDDIDKVLLLDKPSKLTDKRIP